MRVWKVIFAAFVIFAAGAVTGGLSVRLNSRPAASSQKSSPSYYVRSHGSDFINKMQRELDLTPMQRKRIERILDESQDRVKKLCEPINDEFRKVRESIRAELTADQLQKYDTVFKRRGGKSRDGKNWSDDRRGTRSEPASEPKSENQPSSGQER